MRLARVIGPVWGARRAAGLDGAKILRLEPLAHDGRALVPSGGEVEAIDRLGAGPGELVLVAHGSRVRDLTVGATVCDKDIVVAIVDGSDPPAVMGDAAKAASMAEEGGA
jgi:microcompartment protein CcmK/EutM